MESKLYCKGCGGSISATRSGQTVILPSTTITTDSDGKVVEERTEEGGWCGKCVDEWNNLITDV